MMLRCELIAPHGITSLAGEGRPSYPCEKCLAANDGYPPKSLEYSPPLVQILANHYRAKEQKAAREAMAALPAAERKPPTLAKKASSLAAALWRWAGDGFTMTTNEVFERRLAICEACDQFKPRTMACKVCGCRLRAKLRMPSEQCPLDPPKWEAVERASSSKT